MLRILKNRNIVESSSDLTDSQRLLEGTFMDEVHDFVYGESMEELRKEMNL